MHLSEFDQIINLLKEIVDLTIAIFSKGSGRQLLLSRSSIRLVIISLVIASPIAWLCMHRWLQNFAYRIDISWWIFALASIIALIIAFATVSFQAIKVALANPVKSLSME